MLCFNNYDKKQLLLIIVINYLGIKLKTGPNSNLFTSKNSGLGLVPVFNFKIKNN